MTGLALGALGPTELAASLWPIAKKLALKRKTLTFAEAIAAIPALGPDKVHEATWPMHVWCWVRGLPPLNVVVVPKGKTPERDGGFGTSDYDVVHDASDTRCTRSSRPGTTRGRRC